VDTLTIIFITLGIILMCLELIIPGGLSFCFGLSTLIIAFLLETGYETDYFNLAFIWCVSSFVMSILSFIFMNKFLSGESVKECVDEDDNTIGSEAVADCLITKEEGRVHFRGTSWNAISLDKDYKQGDKVTIIAKEDLTFIVEESESNKFENLTKGD